MIIGRWGSGAYIYHAPPLPSPLLQLRWKRGRRDSDMLDENPTSPVAPVPNRNVIEVSAGLVFRHGLLLITQRRPQDHLGGLWEFPGGKRHPNESDEDCLKRELIEELGIEVEVKELIDTVTHAYP